jgi:hypothetical protein
MLSEETNILRFMMSLSKGKTPDTRKRKRKVCGKPEKKKGIKKSPEEEMRDVHPVYSITFGDAAENGPGMETLGKVSSVGFTCNDLVRVAEEAKKQGLETRIIDLADYLPESVISEPASLLVIKKFVTVGKLLDATEKELKNLEWDKKAYFTNPTKSGDHVKWKRARHNICFGDISQEPEYELKKGRVIPFSSTPRLSSIRKDISILLNDKGYNLIAEGNKYYDPKRCGIGWHGDRKRKKVFMVRVGGREPMPFCVRWYHENKVVGRELCILLESGDALVFSEKMVGQDWKNSSKLTLRHSAGCPKFTDTPAKNLPDCIKPEKTWLFS